MIVTSYTIFVEKLLFEQKSSFDPNIAIFCHELKIARYKLPFFTIV